MGFDQRVSLLLTPLTLRAATFRNRIWLAPMCQYSAGADGIPTDWHLMHLGARAAGGFGLLITEATAVTPEGRISGHDTGLWSDDQVPAWRRITDFVRAHGSATAVQLAHAGRKGSVYRTFADHTSTMSPASGGWPTLGPGEIPFDGYAAPQAMTDDQIAAVPEQFAEAAWRALVAGFDAVEIQSAHGYLMHQFLSPLSNLRQDRWGGSLENRARLLLQTVEAVRDTLPDRFPLLVHLAGTEWTNDGLNSDDAMQVAVWLRERGTDLINVSTCGNVPAHVMLYPGHQVDFSRQIKDTGIPTGAVGMINSAELAEQVLADGDADVVLIGRAALCDPAWALRAAAELADELPVLAHDGGDGAAVLPGQGTGVVPQYAQGWPLPEPE